MKNSELDTLTQLGASGGTAMTRWIGETVRGGIDFRDWTPPPRSKTAIDKHRTAVRFSIARGRNRNAGVSRTGAVTDNEIEPTSEIPEAPLDSDTDE